MPEMTDLTERPPEKRMSVARGTLTVPGGVDLGEANRMVATAAAVAAVKRTGDLLPLHHAYLPTLVDVRFDGQGQRATCTVTVRAYARSDLDRSAMLGVAAGLLALVHDVPQEFRIDDLHVVQTLVG